MKYPELTTTVETFEPRVGMTSLVGIWDKDFPLSYGNYCSIKGGPYLCNMWAENLEEWARRNPESGPIEVTVAGHGDREIGYVSDPRLQDWCNNTRLCVTGRGWPSVAAMRHICKTLDAPEDDVCGCETEYQHPRVDQSWHYGPSTGKSTAARTPTKITNRCGRCNRTWEVAR